MIIVKNISYLFFVQILNQVIPFLIIPFLTRNLGLDVYGNYIFLLMLCGFFFIITDAAFSLYGVKKIACAKGSKKKINAIYSEAICAKILVLTISFPIYLLALNLNRSINVSEGYLYFGYLILVFQVFQANWIFQGIEKMKYIALINLLSRILFLLLIYFFVKSKSDLFVLIVINIIFYGCAAFLGYIVLLKLGIKNSFCKFRYGWLFLKKAYPFVFTRAFGALYGVCGGLFLGFFSNPSNVAIYSIGEQLYKGANGLVSPLVQVLYPYTARTKKFFLIYKVAFLFSILSLIISIPVIAYSDEVILFIFGREYIEASSIIPIFALMFIATNISGLIGYPVMVPKGMVKNVNSSVLFGAFVQLMSIFIIYFFYEIKFSSIALSVLISEFSVLSYRIYSLCQRDLDFNNEKNR